MCTTRNIFNKTTSICNTEQNRSLQAQTHDHAERLKPPLTTLEFSSVDYKIAEIGQFIKQSKVRKPIQTSPTVATITSPITFGAPQQTSTIIAREKEYDPTTTSMIASPKTMSPIIAPSIPTSFSTDYDSQSIRNSILDDSLMHPERKHFILQSTRTSVSFGTNVHPDTQALIDNLTNDSAVNTTIGQAKIINTDAAKSTLNQNHLPTIPHSCPNPKMFEFASTTSSPNVSNNIEFEHNHAQNHNFNSESPGNETKPKSSELMPHFPITADIALLQHCAFNSLPTPPSIVKSTTNNSTVIIDTTPNKQNKTCSVSSPTTTTNAPLSTFVKKKKKKK